MRLLRLLISLTSSLAVVVTAAQEKQLGAVVVPRTWDDEAIATLEVPLANPVGSPKHVSADYYYRIPVPAIYKSYPVYAPGHEPPGYMDKLGDKSRSSCGTMPDTRLPSRPRRIGSSLVKIVFDAPTTVDSIVTLAQARDPVWYNKVAPPVASDGTIPFLRYVVRKKGTVEVDQTSCGECHIRVMSGGSTLRGAQGNFNLGRAVNYRTRARFAQSSDPAQLLAAQRLSFKAQCCGGLAVARRASESPQARRLPSRLKRPI